MVYVHKRYVGIFSIIVLLAVFFGVMSSPSDDSSQIPSVTQSGVITDGVSTKPILGYTSEYGPLAEGFYGTELNQVVLQDEYDNLLITQDLKRVFDFFLSGNAAEDPSLIQMRIKEYLGKTLTGDALAQAELILQQYLDFKEALADPAYFAGNISSNNLSQLAEQLTAQRELRDRFLSPEVVEVFFGQSDALDDYTLQRLLILSDHTLDAGQKEEALVDLKSQQPERLQKKEAHTQRMKEIKQQVEQLRASGADDHEVFQFRTEALGVEAAQRFQELDDQRAQWQKRVEEYLSARQEILDHSGISAEEKAKQIEAIKNSRFNNKERLRMLAYEKR